MIVAEISVTVAELSVTVVRKPFRSGTVFKLNCLCVPPQKRSVWMVNRLEYPKKNSTTLKCVLWWKHSERQ